MHSCCFFPPGLWDGSMRVMPCPLARLVPEAVHFLLRSGAGPHSLAALSLAWAALCALGPFHPVWADPAAPPSSGPSSGPPPSVDGPRSPLPDRRDPQESRRRGEYLVTWKEGSSADVVQRTVLRRLARFSPEVVKSLAGQRMFLIRLKNDPGPDAVARLLRGQPGIEAVQPNFLYHTNPPRRPGAPI